MALGKIGDFAKRVVDKAKDKGKSALDRGTALLKTHPGYLATTGIVNFASGLTSGEGLIGAFQSAAGDAWDTYQSGVNAGFLMPYETEQLDESSDGTDRKSVV